MKNKIILPLSVCVSICLIALIISLSKNNFQSLGIYPVESVPLNYAQSGDFSVEKETKPDSIDEFLTDSFNFENSVNKRYVSNVSFNSTIDEEELKKPGALENAVLIVRTLKDEENTKYVWGTLVSFKELASGVLDKDGIKNFDIYLFDTDNENVKELYFVYVTNKDEEKRFAPGVFYDYEKQLLYGKDERGVFSVGFDYDFSQHVSYNPRNAWQRSFGFCSTYDKLINSTLLMAYDTERIKFEYNDKDWMIQIWKGNYLYASGAEVGIYNKSKEQSAEFYYAIKDDEYLDMSMSLVTKEGNITILNRELQSHWWLTGYNLLETYSAEEMILNGVIIFKDQQMLDAFIESAEKIDGFNFSVDGLKVSYSW